jgi:arylsulfatase A-like enzyme
MEKPPNVVCIIAHDLGTDVGAYQGVGPAPVYARGTLTPAIDQLAAEGTLLENHFACAPLCSPARGTLITGRYPHENGLVGLVNRGFLLNPGERTIFHSLHAAGYRTILAGFQHETRDPTSTGYDERHAGLSTATRPALIRTVDRLLEAAATTGTPFWLNVGTNEVHRPWITKAEPVAKRDVIVPPYLPDTPRVRKDIAAFLGVVKAFDDVVGGITSAVEKHGMRETTAIVVTTDHGIALPRAKGFLYDPGLRTTMIWSLPGTIESGARVEALTSGIDFAPTVAAFCGFDAMPSYQGQSYLDQLEGTPDPSRDRDLVFAEKSYHDVYDPIRAVRSATHKLILNYVPTPEATSVPLDIKMGGSFKDWNRHASKTPRPAVEFYDLRTDPNETTNLATNESPPPEMEAMKVALLDLMERTGDPILHGPVPAPATARVDNARLFPHLKGRGRWPWS